MSCPINHSSEGINADESKTRVHSSIPRTDSSLPWLYPSPEQLHAALVRKGHAVAPQETPHILLLHNVVNEQCWVEIRKWEQKDPSISLKRFQGRPNDISPKAWVKHNMLGYAKPFDRHDWIVQRGDGTECRYVIDFYPGAPRPGTPVSIHLDVRPALDSPSAAFSRLAAFTQSLFKSQN